MKRAITIIAPVLAMLVLGIPGRAQGATGTTNVAVTVAVEASLTVTGTSTLTESVVGAFAGNFTGTTALTYKVRTSKAGGSGTITAKVTTEFSPAGGPNVGTSGTSGDTLAYTCTVAASGTGCTGSQTASLAASTPLATFGTDAKSSKAFGLAPGAC